MASCWKALTRRKRLDTLSLEDSKLARVLNTVDLTALGVGSTLGVGVYVLAGDVSKNLAGPAVVLSFLFAAVASLFAGSASVAKGLSLYLDSLLNNTMKEAFRTIAPMNISFMSPYFDFFSFSASMSLTVALALGVKESSFMNNILTTLNMGVVLFVIIAGSWKANPQNWKISKQDIPPGVNGGKGGFLPFGFVGALKGAATCFYGFVGFDCIATTGEEVKNPQKAIPDEDAPIPFVFREVGWPVAQWIVAVGGIFGLCASLFGAMFPLPRIIYAMATDGLLFKFLGLVHPTFQTPLVGTLIAGTFTGLMSALFELEQLVNMMSIGTLIAYTIVAACVLLLRYKAELDEEGYSLLLTQMGDIADSSDNSEGELEEQTVSVYKDNPDDGSDIISSEYIESTNLVTLKEVNSFESITKQLFNVRRLKCPTPLSSNIVAIQVFIFCLVDYFFYGMWQSGATHSKRKGIKRIRLGHENKGFILGDEKSTSDQENPKTSQGAMNLSQDNVLTMSQNSEHFPIKVLPNHDVRSGQNQETVSEVSGHVSKNVRLSKNTNNGVVNETEEDLYPNVIVIPHGDTDEDSQGESCKIEGESEAVYEEDENCTAERSDDEQINKIEMGPINDIKDPNKVWRKYETQESELSGERSSQDSFHSAVDVINEHPKNLESMNRYDQNENNNGSSTIDNFEVLKKQQIMGGLSSLKFVKKGISEDESSSGSEDEVFVDTVDPKEKLETR
uniref:Uncharacterized protein n=1 Tax=Timema shepardi TaxID=629360 RepID=A0A7R9FZH9_TIMSH|nr:unnamed protein product [Timema shepardi]